MLHHSRRVCFEQIPREHTAFCRLFSYVPFSFSFARPSPSVGVPRVRRRFTRSTRFITRFTRYNVHRDSRGLDRARGHLRTFFPLVSFHASPSERYNQRQNGNDGDAQRSSPRYLLRRKKRTAGRVDERTERAGRTRITHFCHREDIARAVASVGRKLARSRHARRPIGSRGSKG